MWLIFKVHKKLHSSKITFDAHTPILSNMLFQSFPNTESNISCAVYLYMDYNRIYLKSSQSPSCLSRGPQLEGWKSREGQLKLSLKGAASAVRKEPECPCSDPTCSPPPLTSPPTPARPPGAFLVVNMGVLDQHWFSPDSFDLQQVWRGSAK